MPYSITLIAYCARERAGLSRLSRSGCAGELDATQWLHRNGSCALTPRSAAAFACRSAFHERAVAFLFGRYLELHPHGACATPTVSTIRAAGRDRGGGVTLKTVSIGTELTVTQSGLRM